MTSYFEFQYPWVLALLALLPIYAFLKGRSGAASSLKFSSAELIRSVGGLMRNSSGRMLLFFRLLIVALAILALAGPRNVNEHTERQQSGVDIMLVLDLSWSMMALDMAPPGQLTTRYDIAQTVLKDFVAKRPADRVGLVVFSGVPYLISPPTLNHDWLQDNLDRLHIGMINELGTAIGDATGLGVKRLSRQKDSRGKVLILLTDGDNNKWETLEPLPAANFARSENVRIYSIGIGKDAACPLYDFDRETGKLRLGPNGLPASVFITLQPANYVILDKMAKATGGKSYTATNKQELDTVYENIDSLEKTDVKLRHHRTYTPLFYIPLLAATGLLLLEVLLANTRFRRVP